VTWGGERVEPAPAGAGRADVWTESDAAQLRLLLALDLPAERLLAALPKVPE
jgi:hypothetical protein